METYRYVLKQTLKDGSVWTSEEKTGLYRAVCQDVIAGLSGVDPGCERWAETPADDAWNPCFFLYGINRNGKEGPPLTPGV